MAADPRDTDPADQTPRERGLERRSDAPVVSPWLIVVGVLLLAGLVYVVSGLL